ncbi:NTP transferase domain-containing protein [Chloroflexota bacterium]
MKTKYAAIVLAAGLSSRLEGFKPLLSMGGETITDHVVSTFLANGVEVYLVVGWRRQELMAGIKNKNITIVENPDYRQGMFTSVQAGLRHLPPNYAAFFAMPVDIPLVRPSTVAGLLSVAAEHPDSIIYPVFGGRRGHPTLVPLCLAPAIMDWKGDGGLKAVLDSRREMALEVAVTDSNILFDVDTSEDYRVLLERFQRDDMPTASD